MASKKLKCPARITEYKEEPRRYVYNKSKHEHAPLKRGKYFVKPDFYPDYTMVEESVIGSEYEYTLPEDNE